jgi:hypothetical protein
MGGSIMNRMRLDQLPVLEADSEENDPEAWQVGFAVIAGGIIVFLFTTECPTQPVLGGVKPIH